MRNGRLLAATTAVVALVAAAPANAQDVATASPQDATSESQPGDIIVTAQRRAERLQDVPITITALSSQTLERANVQQLADIAKLSPAVRFDYASDFVQPSIRGVGNAVVTAGGSSNVGIYVDGFYLPNPLSGDFQLLNVEGIQVLKGPQGTLFGRNTTGGAILVTTTAPSQETRGVISASYGRFNTAIIQGYATTGVTENIAVDLAASYRRSDGYQRNIVPGPKHPGRSHNWSVRAGVKFDVSDSTSFLLRYSHQDIDDATNEAFGILVQDGVNYAGRLIVPNPANPAQLIRVPIPAAQTPTGYRETAVNPGDQPTFRYKSDVVQLTGNFDLGFADLTSYTQYRTEKGRIYADQDQTALDLFFNTIPVVNKTFTHEFVLSSHPGSRLNWTTGLFYFNNIDQYLDGESGVLGQLNKSPASTYFEISTHSRTQSIAAFADVTYEVLDHLFVTLGARYSHDKFDRAQFRFYPFPATNQPMTTGSVLTPRAVVRYELNDRSSVYASYSQGYKAPLTDVISGLSVNREKMNAYEVGFKHASSLLTLNLAGWYYDYSGLQVSVFEGGLSKVINAASAEIYGAEGEVRVRVTPDFELNASAAYVHAKYKSFPSDSRYVLCSDLTGDLAGCLAGGGYDRYLLQPFDGAGLPMQRAPKFTASAGASYGFDAASGRVTLSGNIYHSSKFFFDAAAQFYQKPYTTVGLRAEWKDRADRVTLAVYGENIFNEKYYSQVLAHGSGIGTVWAVPATWGVSVKYKFGR